MSNKRRVISDSELDLSSKDYIIIAKLQEGNKGGDHCFNINEKEEVTCNGCLADENSVFKVYTAYLENVNSKVCVFHCIAKDLVVAISGNKICSKKPSTDYKNIQKVINVEDVDEETLFEQIPDKNDPIWFSYSLFCNKKKVLRFDHDGIALNPDNVCSIKEESLFQPFPA